MLLLDRMSYWFAVAMSQRRRARWERVFGTDRLPILDARPRRAEFRDGPALVYDVALGRLHEGQLNRLAAYLARRNGMGYEEARLSVLRCGLMIHARGVMVVTADAAEHRPFVFGGAGATPRWSSV